LTLLCGASSVHAQAAAGLRVAEPRCEYLENPLGIDVLEPRLSWTLEAADPMARGQRQSAYRILVASEPERLARGEGDLWDSGEVKSDRSIHVPYAGRPLGSRARCWWSVRVRDGEGRESAWSEPASWTMGLLKPDDWAGAKWVGLEGGEEGLPLGDFRSASWVWFDEGNPAADAPAATRYFRRAFELPAGKRVARAECFVAADDAATVYVNGKQVATAAGHPNLVRVELGRDAFREGANVIAIAAVNGNAPVPANPAGLICSIRVDFDDAAGQEPLVITTDAAWRASDGEAAGWMEPAFDDAAWGKSKVLGAIGIGPWGDPYGQSVKSEHRRLPARMLRRDFAAKKDVVRATATVCGLGFYELYVNGRKVGDRLMDPGLTEYTKRCLYATYDVTDGVKSGGDNAVGVILGNGRFFAPRLNVPVPTVTYGYPKLLLNLRLEYADGSVQDVVSDESWRVTTDGPTRANSEYDGEEYDARLEQDGWADAGFDAAKWQPAQVVPAPGGALQAQMIEPVRVTEILKPVAITEPKPGVFVVDFGQAFYGVPRLTVKAPAGTRVEMRSSFGVRPDGTLNVENDRTARNTDVYTARGAPGDETWRPRFKGNAIRRVQVTGFPGRLKLHNLEGHVVHTDHPSVGQFACSNDLVNRIYLNARWGTRLQNRSIPMEPDRDERQGWSGHPAKTSESEGFCFNVAPFYASWLHSVRLDQHADGALQEISPGYWTFASKGTIWPAIVTIIPNWLHDFYGDDRALRDNYDAMRRWVEYHERTNQKPDGTLDHSSYPDWVDASWIGKRHDEPSSGTASMPFISTAYHHHNLRLVARAAKLLGKPEDAARFEATAAKVKAGFNARFFDPKANKYDIGNQFSYVLPLAFGLVPEDHRRSVIDNLVEQVMVRDRGHTTVGLLGMQWQMQVLTDAGHPEVAYSIATRTERPSWGYMIARGGTTIWERWDTDTQDGGMNGESQKILSGNFEAWCYQTLAGINHDPGRPAFKHVILRPRPVGDLTWAKASHRSMHGEVRSAWRMLDGQFHWDVRVPPNTTATVYVPASDAKEVTEGGVPADEAPGVRFVRAKEGAAVYEVGSGTYAFRSNHLPGAK
jgi:alpha-L-rhamnosidase